MKYFMASRTMITNHSGCPHSIPNDDGRDHFILDMWSKFSRTATVSAHFATTTFQPIFGHILVGGVGNFTIPLHTFIYLPHMDKSLCNIAVY